MLRAAERGRIAGDPWKMRNVLIAVLALMQPVCGFSQTSISVPTAQRQPESPMPQQVPGQTVPGTPNAPQSSNLRASAAAPTPLSLEEAEALALKNNPQISVA